MKSSFINVYRAHSSVTKLMLSRSGTFDKLLIVYIETKNTKNCNIYFRNKMFHN